MNEGVPTELERLFFVSSDENAVLARTFEEHRENLRNICFSSLRVVMFGKSRIKSQGIWMKRKDVER